MPTPTPVPTLYLTATPVPIPPTEFKGGFVLKVGHWYGFYQNKNITFKIDDMSTDKTLVHGTGRQTLVDLYAHSDDSSDVVIDTSIRTNPQNPPWVLAGRAYIDGQVAPDGTWVTAWSDGVQIPGAAVQVNNNPTPKVPPGLEELLNRTRAQQRPAPTPCPWCEEPYQGPLKDAPVIILNAWQGGRQPIGESEAIGENSRWGFYSSLPEWRLANDLPKSESSCYGEWVWFGGDTMINPLDFGFSEGSESREHKTTTQLAPGWNGGPLCVP